MSAIAQYKLFKNLLFEKMTADGFNRKRNGVTIKAHEQSQPRLTLYSNKLCGEDALSLTYIIGQSFAEIDQLIYYLRNEYFSSHWVTGRIWLGSIMPSEAKTNGLPNMLTNGYTHKIDDDMNIPLLADEVYGNLKTYAYPFWDKYSSFQEILAGLDENRPELHTWAVQGSVMVKIAGHLMNGDKEKAKQFAEQSHGEYLKNHLNGAFIEPEVFVRMGKIRWENGRVMIPPKPKGTPLR